MPPNLPLVILLSLHSASGHEELIASLRTVSRPEKITTAEVASICLEAGRGSKPAAVVVTDAAITENENSALLAKLVEYGRNGGRVIFAHFFSSLVQFPDLNAMFESAWSLPWRVGDYTSLGCKLNKQFGLFDTNKLVKSFYAKALHVRGVPRAATIYLPTGAHADQTAFAFAPIGQGYVGYVGEVGVQKEHIDAVVAMCTRKAMSADQSAPVKGAPTRPIILLLSLMKDRWADEMLGHPFKNLRACSTVHLVESFKSLKKHLDSATRPQAIVAIDSAITEPKWNAALARVTEFVRSGGIVVCAGTFTGTVKPLQLPSFFLKWGLPWERGSYYRTTVYLSKTSAVSRTPFASLPASTSVKAMHLKNVSPEHALYNLSSSSHMESHVFAPDSFPVDTEETSVAYARVGHGHLGYVGDVNAEEDSTRIVLAMCRLPFDHVKDEPYEDVVYQFNPNGPATVIRNGVPDGVRRTLSSESTMQGRGKQAVHENKRPRRPREAEVEARAAKRAEKAKEKQAKGEVLKNLGNTEFRKQNFEAAERHYADAMLADRPRAVNMVNLALCFLKMERYSEAEMAASSALRCEPSNLKARFRRGLAKKELARRGMQRYQAAIIDFNTCLEIDPTLKEAIDQIKETQRLKDDAGSPDHDFHDDTPIDDAFAAVLPLVDDEPSDTFYDDNADSSDFEHEGNGIPCRHYNHNGCKNGKSCKFKHGPTKCLNTRDQLGRNVCNYWLLHECRFGDAKCVYAHSKEYLPKKGWWTDEEERRMMKILLDAEKMEREFSHHSEELMSQGVMPWDDDAADVMAVLNGRY